jgi:hypothetical protein
LLSALVVRVDWLRVRCVQQVKMVLVLGSAFSTQQVAALVVVRKAAQGPKALALMVAQVVALALTQQVRASAVQALQD